MNTKSIVYLLIGFLAFPIIALVFTNGKQMAQVYADIPSSVLTGRGMMGNYINNRTLTPYDRNTMVEMMKEYHGENWRQGCNSMMDSLDDDTI